MKIDALNNHYGKGDYWAYAICNGCYSMCSVRVRVIDGCPVKVEGIPESDMGCQGGICSEGMATIMAEDFVGHHQRKQ